MSSRRDMIKKGIQETGTKYGPKTNRFKITDDNKPYHIRVLPGNFGTEGVMFYFDQAQHWGPNPESSNGMNMPFPCLNKQTVKGESISEEECPFCQKVSALFEKKDELTAQVDDADDADEREEIREEIEGIKKILKNIGIRVSYGFNVIDRAESTPLTRLYHAPKTVGEAIWSAYLDEDEDIGDIDDILDENAGFDFIVSRKKKENQTEYTVKMARKASPISEDEAEIKRVLDARYDLESPEYMKIPSMETYEKSLNTIIASAGDEPPETRKSENLNSAAERLKKQKEKEEDEGDELPGVGKDEPPARSEKKAESKVKRTVEDDDEKEDEAEVAEKTLAQEAEDAKLIDEEPEAEPEAEEEAEAEAEPEAEEDGKPSTALLDKLKNLGDEEDED